MIRHTKSEPYTLSGEGRENLRVANHCLIETLENSFMQRVLSHFFQSKGKIVGPSNVVVVVSGLPRSGTSMMMTMLEMGGLLPLTDAIRLPDDDNPRGYYEFERVKQLEQGDVAWLPQAVGKAVKIISTLLKHLPSQYTYYIVYMNRQMQEVLNSQRKMLQHRGQTTDSTDDAQMAELLKTHEVQMKAWLNQQPNFQVLDVDYNATLINPATTVKQVNTFLGGGLHEKRMIESVDPGLYRNRNQVNRR